MLVIPLVGVFAPTPLGAESLVFDLEWGGFGTASGQLDTPKGIDIGPSGDVFVSEWGNDRISRFTPTGQLVLTFGSLGNDPGQLWRPDNIAFGPSGHLYVTDVRNDRIQKFTEDGTYVAEWGGYGTGPGLFDRPWGIATDASGFVYVVSILQPRVQKFTADGTFVTQWAIPNSVFARPHGLTVAPSGDVYVSDPFLHTVLKFSPAGALLLTFGTHGSLPGEMYHPHSVKWTPTNDLVVVDWLEHDPDGDPTTHAGRLQSWTELGVFNGVMYESSRGSGPGEFDHAYTMAMDASGVTYVADSQNHRIQKFSPLAVSVESEVAPSSWGTVKSLYRR